MQSELSPADDRLVPDHKLRDRYDVCGRTITRWNDDPRLEFPKAIVINGRMYRRLSDLIA
jgi:hypothetical protein